MLYVMQSWGNFCTVARLVGMPVGIQAVSRSIPAPGKFVHADFVCHGNISTAILPIPLIQEELLSNNGKRMYSKCC